ncbi:pollen-specific leucine-rich repeat extensin-like protein 3-like [Hibiscus syriacus]|uniref:Pollen-specific leucine-rich repeat extensin-like protein 3-like n=1 Tax=Hibiscus syriacus TaxID=106335 RepID=A0A6A2X572_HIBSY|nr:pollen-specific leucine-rich repeat extensin-like protein 3-like [Hibiscus syriacus]
MLFDPFKSLLIYMAMIIIFFALVVFICNGIRKRNPKSSDGKATTTITTATPSLLLEVKVMLPIKVIFGDVTVAKRFDPTELAHIPKTRLGEGTLGTLFKVVLGCGLVVTIRKIREGLTVSAVALEMWVNFFGGMKDDGLLLPIHFSFWYGGEAFILYEYLILGSLEELLHGSEGIQFTPLKWGIRKRIALYAAQAVALIHSRVTHDVEPLICGVIKASNILIRVDFSACLSSYETPYLVPPETIVKRNPGRVAPELKGRHPKTFTRKSDVYSFGVLLLELVTGERPSMTNLRAYVFERKVKWGLSSVYDKKMGDLVNENLAGMIEIARACLLCKPQGRPSMEDVVRMIKAL